MYMETKKLAELIIKAYDENDYFTNLDEWQTIWDTNYDDQDIFLDIYLLIKNLLGRTDVSKDYLGTIFYEQHDEYDSSMFYTIDPKSVDWTKYVDVYKDLIDLDIYYGSDVDLRLASYFLKDNKSQNISEEAENIKNLILKKIKSNYDCYMFYDIEKYVTNWDDWKDCILDILVLDEENIDNVATLFLKFKCEDINEIADFYVNYANKIAEVCGDYRMQPEIAKYAHNVAVNENLKINVNDLDKNRHLGELICSYIYNFKNPDNDEFDIANDFMIDCNYPFNDEAIKILKKYIQMFLCSVK